jgi:membrane protease YdiL (CAAX protease family)
VASTVNLEPFAGRNLRLTVVSAAVIVVCSVYVRIEYDRAFPQASVNLRLTRAEITARALELVRSQHWPVEGFKELTVFDPDDDARLYLEREVGLQRANQLMSGPVSVWRWRARWFRPPQEEEMLVWLSPDGRLVGFRHVIPETAAGARLSHDDALALARKFVSGTTKAGLRLVEDQLQQRPNRYDYRFTWEQEGFRAKDATYRQTVVVQGGQVGRYQEFLHVPESWQRDFAGLRSRNDLYATIAQAFWLPLVIATLVLVVRGLRRREIPWRPLLLLSGAVGALTIANQWNSIPLLIDQLPTSLPYGQSLLLLILQSLGAGVGVFFYVILPGAAGEPGYRRWTSSRLSLTRLVTADGAGSGAYYRAVVAGYGFAALHLAFLVAFYLVSRRFGAWSPQDVEYSNLLSTAMPWIYPVAIAAMASAAEEFWFRLLAVPLLKRWLKIEWLAIVIPAFIWGFLHANYPQQPAWIRGVEVGLIGIGAGCLMLRFGIVATLVWHYTIDAFLIGMNLFSASSWYYRVSGGILGAAILAPLLVSIVFYRRRRGFTVLDEPAPVGTAEPAREQPGEPPPELVRVIRPAWNRRWLIAAAAAAAITLVTVAPRTFGDWIRIRITASQAEAIARARIPNPQHWRMSTDFIPNLDVAEFEYLRRVAGPDAANRIVRERKPSAVWRVRFFRPLEKQEWRIYIDQSGQVIRTDHLLDEKAPGAQLTEDSALAKARAALPVSGMQLLDSSVEKRENRTDYQFVFQDPSFHAGGAQARMSIELHGGEPSNFRRFLKLPDEWLREFTTPSLRNFALPALAGAFAMPLLILFLRRLGAHETRFHWRAYLATGGVAFIAAALSSMNQFRTAMSGYDTAMPEQNYLSQYLIGRLILIVLTSFGVAAAVLAADVFRQAALGRSRITPPSLSRAACVSVLLAGTAQFIGWALDHVPGPRQSLQVWNIAGLDAYLPGLRPITQSYLTAVIGVACAATLVFAGIRYMHARRRFIAAGLAVLAIAISQSQTPLEFAAHAAAALVWIAVFWVVIQTCAADLIGLCVAVFWASAIARALLLMKQPAGAIRWNGIAAAAAAIVIGAIVILMHRREAPSRPSR